MTATAQNTMMENMGFEDTEGGKVSVRGNDNVNGHFGKKKSDHLMREEKLHIYKNVLLISFSFLLLFTAYESRAVKSVGALKAELKVHVQGGTARVP